MNRTSTYWFVVLIFSMLLVRWWTVNSQKYYGVTAEGWAKDFDNLAGCIEDVTSYTEGYSKEEIVGRVQSCL